MSFENYKPFSESEIRDAYDSIGETISSKYKIKELIDVLDVLDNNDITEARTYDLYCEYFNPEFMVKLADQILDSNDYTTYTQREMIEEMKDRLLDMNGNEPKYLLDSGVLTYNHKQMMSDEKDNSYLIEISDDEYIYGEVSELVGDYAKEWDELSEKEKIAFILDEIDNDELPSNFDSLKDYEQFEFLTQSFLTRRDDIIQEVSYLLAVTRENRFYITARLEDELISKDDFIERLEGNASSYLEEDSSHDAINHYCDWNEEKILEEALETSFSRTSTYIQIGSNKLSADYIQCDDIASACESNVIYTLMDMKPEIFLNKETAISLCPDDESSEAALYIWVDTIDKNFMREKDFVKELLTRNGNALKYVSTELREDLSVCLAAYNNTLEAKQYCCERFIDIIDEDKYGNADFKARLVESVIFKEKLAPQLNAKDELAKAVGETGMRKIEPKPAKQKI